MKSIDTASVAFVNQHSVTEDHLELLASLPYSKTGTRRLCFHESNQSNLHMMLVQASPENAFPRHCHTDSDEFTTVVSGGLEIELWPEGIQSPSSVIVLGRDFSGAHAALVRKGIPHTTRPLTEQTIYLEIKLGPFNRGALKKA
jgi:cupin fold WbuC family metalloprotein